MLRESWFHRVSDEDQRVFDIVVPRDHFLIKVLAMFPWDSLVELLEVHYATDKGRPAISPLVMLKLEYLRYHYRLSDREVIDRAETDLAFREFLQLSLKTPIPCPSSLCVFRGRLGLVAFRTLFDKVVGSARELGFVRDRLRIKDATHVIGNMAIPTALALVAQTRNKLLEAAKPFAPNLVAGEEINLDLIRESTKKQPVQQRLAARLGQLRSMLDWADQVCAPQDATASWQHFLNQRDLAQKILEDQKPKTGDKTLSTTDPDARRGRHGHFYDGYMVDILVDSDSEIITQINVLPANGNESMDAVTLLEREQAAHGNQVESISIDGAGFSGPLLRTLESPHGLNVEAFVPVPAERVGGRFRSDDFTENPDSQTVTCPAGQLSNPGSHSVRHESTRYRFTASVCRACPLLQRCMKTSPKTCGRTVCKSDYRVEHQRAKEKTETDQYKQVKQEHPKVERKLGEIMNRHGGRQANYFGIAKVAVQEVMAGMTTNIKRIVRLTCAPLETLAAV